MKVLLFASPHHEARDVAIARGLLQRAGVVLTDVRPDVVVSYGGDGTFMQAEYAYPGVPKLLLKKSRICKLCSPVSNKDVIARFLKKQYRVESLMKIEARAKGKKLLGINDIIVHNQDPRHAIRYEILIDEKPMGKEIIGDGIVAATPLGSTGYYRSITDSFFEVGMGLAFNNSTEQADHMVLRDSARIVIHIVRGPAIVYADNQPESVVLEAGDDVVLRMSKQRAHIIRFEK